MDDIFLSPLKPYDCNCDVANGYWGCGIFIVYCRQAYFYFEKLKILPESYKNQGKENRTPNQAINLQSNIDVELICSYYTIYTSI